jgi:hypothetical protein
MGLVSLPQSVLGGIYEPFGSWSMMRCSKRRDLFSWKSIKYFALSDLSELGCVFELLILQVNWKSYTVFYYAIVRSLSVVSGISQVLDSKCFTCVISNSHNNLKGVAIFRQENWSLGGLGDFREALQWCCWSKGPDSFIPQPLCVATETHHLPRSKA